MNKRTLTAVACIAGVAGVAYAATKPKDPLENFYGNTLISERLINRSGGGGAAHVWLERDGTYISFDVTTGGRYGTFTTRSNNGVTELCMNYPKPIGTMCYPIESREIGEVWLVADPGTTGKNSLVKGHQ